MKFLEIYKRIDQFLKDSLSSDKGVSSYLEEIERLQYSNWYGVDWKNTYKNLKNYRYIRNKIVHEVGVDEGDYVNEYDIDWLNTFYSDLLSCNDPLTLMHQKSQNNDCNKLPKKENDYNENTPLLKKENLFKKFVKIIKNFFN